MSDELDPDEDGVTAWLAQHGDDMERFATDIILAERIASMGLVPANDRW